MPFNVRDEPQEAEFQISEEAREKDLRAKVAAAFKCDHFLLTRNVGKCDIKEVLASSFRIGHLLQKSKSGEIVAYERSRNEGPKDQWQLLEVKLFREKKSFMSGKTLEPLTFSKLFVVSRRLTILQVKKFILDHYLPIMRLPRSLADEMK